MNGKIFFVLGSGFGFLGVMVGAFGAHALKTKLSGEMLSVFEVGVRYHMYHALALLGVAWAVTQFPHSLVPASGWCFVAGTVIFSGSLYALALTGVKLWGAVTPIGGLFLLCGWAMLALGAWKSRI